MRRRMQGCRLLLATLTAFIGTALAFSPGLLLSPSFGGSFLSKQEGGGVSTFRQFSRKNLQAVPPLLAGKKGASKGGGNKQKGSSQTGKDKAGKEGGLEAAKAAAIAAESISLEDLVEERGDEVAAAKQEIDKRARFDASTDRMQRFEEGLSLERMRKPEGRNIQGNDSKSQSNKKDDLDDTDIKELLAGKKKQSKKEFRDSQRLRTETGEELLLAEFAPGTDISSFAKPTPMAGGDLFDPMNLPLPSELASRKQARSELNAAEMPLVSELSSPSQVSLYNDIAEGVQDESLFRIKSVFDKREGFIPGRSDIPASSSMSRGTAAPKQDKPLQRPSEPLVGMVVDDEEEVARPTISAVTSSLGEALSRGLSLLVALDFFVVLFFLGWLGVSIVYQFAVCGELTREGGPVCNNPVYTTWYSLWTPVIQPLLGILFLGTIGQATVNTLRGSGNDK